MNEPKLEIWIEEWDYDDEGMIAVVGPLGMLATVPVEWQPALRKHLNEQHGHQWCRYSGPRRGDCSHFVGLPETLDETTCDEYGIPHGWCDYCWLQYRFEHLNEGMVERWEAINKGLGVGRRFMSRAEAEAFIHGDTEYYDIERILVPAEQGE